ncbi:MAG: ATP-dependent helicase [Candidatus Nanohalarchaeota archaeon]|nr:MAG: ATP-dependent helicase [Candidatus Nanohaloarchaeota archaeon]
MEKFIKLGITEPVLKVIEDEKFEKPTDIQEKAIPVVLEGKDIIAASATGSGKTLAFAVGILKTTEKKKGIQTLILTPTRELAEQVSEAIRMFSKYLPLKIVVVYGGVSINPQIDKLRSADIVVGTPGRILDHMARGTINFSKIKTFVLDEADRMLDMGFIDDVEKIMRQCPDYRQTLLFSATMPPRITELSKKYMKSPVKVSAEEYVDTKKLTQVFYEVEDELKFSLLVHLLRNEKKGLVMIFCNSRRNVDFVADNLKFSGIEASAMHGGFTQEKRSKTMKHFTSQRVYALVCTDVAARGLDIPGVTHVYNYDIPSDSKEYIHRIGRTARAGKDGKAINILANRDFVNFRRVLRNNDVDVKREQMPFIEKVKLKKVQNSGRTGSRFGGKRSSGGSGGRFGGQRKSSGSGGRFNSQKKSGKRKYSGITNKA